METSALDSLLDRFSAESKTQREKGTAFENVAKHYLTYDKLQNSVYDQVWLYPDWARENGRDATDTGIDLVAKRRDGSGLVAIQAKFYLRDAVLKQAHLNGFISNSTDPIFTSRLLVDTTERELSTNAQKLIRTKDKPFVHIKRNDLQESSIDWSSILHNLDVRQRSGKEPRDHQNEAIDRTLENFKTEDRGQLIMACGTGKTYTAQVIAERLVGEGGSVLVLVPSLALMSQTILEWNRDASIALRSFSACSDASVGKRRTKGNSDQISIELQDLVLPATTDTKLLAKHVNQDSSDRMTVVFSTYQSINVIELAQKLYGMPDFDLIICDEAHRTTGKVVDTSDDSNFVRVHSQEHIRGEKRLYMTATPRIFAADTKKKATEGSVTLCSMDNEAMFGRVFYYCGFGKAVQQGLLSDYRVIILALDEAQVSRDLQNLLASQNELQLDSATRILGCYKALNKQSLSEGDYEYDPNPMQKAMLFCNSIKNSKTVAEMFNQVVEEYKSNVDDGSDLSVCDVEHIDGTFNSKVRSQRLEWLSNGSEEACHVLSNVRCLGEGVDIPSLDAVIFIHPRKSQIDVVQAVGRVMRRAADKKMGYIILPIGIESGTDVETALRNNKKYETVWQTLNALRSHDERIAAGINAMAFGEPLDDRIKITYDKIPELEEATGIPKDSLKKSKKPGVGDGPLGGEGEGEEGTTEAEGGGGEEPSILDALISDNPITRGLSSMIVKKCGSTLYWTDWASNIADIAKAHVIRIRTIVDPTNVDARKVFEQFMDELHDDLNTSITENDAIEMLAQHLITRPVFDAVFEHHPFSQHNSVSKAMGSVLEMLDAHHIDKESESLEIFYDSVRTRASQVKSSGARQELIRQLYDKFFQTAFKSVTSRLGIVYTPIEIVDYILHSVEDVLRYEFGCSISDEGIHVLDPFTGTGTFIARLIESGLIKDQDLVRKYRKELHANEILLLAYYIAGVNVEQAYYKRRPTAEYETFNNLLLTDTFNVDESKGELAEIFPSNQERINRQRNLDIKVIVGNPPYSAGQRSANDNAANVAYPALDQKIADSYAANSNATNKNSLYDSYIRAIKWASEKVDDKGIVAFVTNAGWFDGSAMDGMRKCLSDEYSKMWIFNLRGNARTSGEQRRREAGNVFESGSRAAVAINVFVKDSDWDECGKIYYHDIGDYLNKEEKLDRIAELHSVSGTKWSSLRPDEYNDWINQRDPEFEKFLIIGEKRKVTYKAIFELYSAGLKTNRDAWCYNASRRSLIYNVERSISFFNSEVERYRSNSHTAAITDFVDLDAMKFSWDSEKRKWVQQGRQIEFQQHRIYTALYRPFFKCHSYFDRSLNSRVYQNPSVFPTSESQNRLICVNGVGASQQTALMVDGLPDVQFVSNGQCFPLYRYEISSSASGILEESNTTHRYEKIENISQFVLEFYRSRYSGLMITAEDLFYYLYGVLHSPNYRERFAANLLKQLPRIPAVTNADDFLQFSEIGRQLGDLHVGYESVKEYPLEVIYTPKLNSDEWTDECFRVSQMKFGKLRSAVRDRSRIDYNAHISLSGIPSEAYEYEVNGKSAIEWVMDRQCVKTDKASGIVNDANDYAIDTVGDPSYPLRLLKKVVTVSLRTKELVDQLPELRL